MFDLSIKSLIAILSQSIKKKVAIIIIEIKIMLSLKNAATFFVESPSKPYLFR